MSNIINENQEQLISVSIEKTKTILYQMENCICKIYKNNEVIGTGFLCKIPFNNYLLKVLITNNHILNENDIENNNIIDISIYNKDKKEEIKEIIINKKRKNIQIKN